MPLAWSEPASGDSPGSMGVGLTDGLREKALEQRLVSLSYQHRMRSDVSAFPRQQFYTSAEADDLEPAHRRWLDMYGTEYHHDKDYLLPLAILGPLERARQLRPDRQGGALLRDASGIDVARTWSYNRYAPRALWLELDPGRRCCGATPAPVAAGGCCHLSYTRMMHGSERCQVGWWRGPCVTRSIATSRW